MTGEAYAPLRAGCICTILLAGCMLGSCTPAASAADPGRAAQGLSVSVPIVLTDSPRKTLASFVHLRDALETVLGDYRQTHTVEKAARVALIVDQMRALFDFSAVPDAARREVSDETVAYVLDVLGRVGYPDLGAVPDLDAVDAGNLKYYAVPSTPFRIVEMDDGARAGEFLFSSETVQSAPRFFRGIENMPLRSSLPIRSWIEESQQLTGPLIPAALVRAMPASLRRGALGTPIWKILATAVAVVLGTGLVLAVHRVARPAAPAETALLLWRRALAPLFSLAITYGVWRFATMQVNVSGAFAWGVDLAAVLVGYLTLAWAAWLVSLAAFESIVRRGDFPEETLDANMLRLLARIVGVIGVVVVLATGAQAIGLPVVSVLAGLGIGGLAVALAIRPTLENLIGGFILYLDRPIRVGDWCSFGTQSGTVERIGVRSTQVRAMDRTVISVPNAQFADMQITNWAACDQMLIQQTIGLRYETDGDQLRYVLAKMREMFHSHPRIAPDSIRVRFAGYGDSSLNVLIRVYARTREWNDFYAIQEDVLFRIKEIVEQSGTGFAFPSQTLYVGRDHGLDAALGETAKKEVAAWRRAGRLPFPRFPAGILERLAGTLHYPPRGSPDFRAPEEELARPGDEPLSAPPPEPVVPANQEPPKQEAPKQDAPKQEGAKQDAARTGEPERA